MCFLLSCWSFVSENNGTAAFSALTTLLVRRQEEHLVCKKSSDEVLA